MAERTILITGATSLIAQHCARLWAAEAGTRFILAGRNRDGLERVAADLRTRAPGTVCRVIACDLTDPQAVAALFADATPDITLIAQGLLPDQSACNEDLTAVSACMSVTALSPMLCAQAAAQTLARQGRGTLAIIGSVAGDRGRQSNYLYGAAKASLATLAQGLAHRFAGRAVHVLLIKPGPTATPMTAHLAGTRLALADPAEVARDIHQAVARGKRVLYTPARWRLIMMLIRALPDALFHRLPL